MVDLIAGYSLRKGSGLDRALLVKFMQRTYQELYPGDNFAHLSQTVEQYFSNETPLWWVEKRGRAEEREEGGSKEEEKEKREEQEGGDQAKIARLSADARVANPQSPILNPIACLWLGNAVDQVWGDRHAYIFLLYVSPEHRRRGIGSALMHHAENWAKARGDRQIGLQVFYCNQPALRLYEHLGYQPQSIWMVKPL